MRLTTPAKKRAEAELVERLLARVEFERLGAPGSLWPMIQVLRQPALLGAIAPLATIHLDLLSEIVRAPGVVRFPIALRLIEGTVREARPRESLARLGLSMRRLDAMAIKLGLGDPAADYSACTTMAAVERLVRRWGDRLNQ